LLGAYLATVTGWPQIFRGLQSSTAVALGAGLLLATAAGVAVHTTLEDARRSFQLRGAGAALAAAALALPALFAAGGSGVHSLAPLIGPCLALLACLLLACALLLAGGPAAATEGSAGPERVRPRDVTALDSLTQLPTRVFFESRLAAVARACDSKNRRMALFFIDLDGFKPINDSFGHQTGDQVLEQVGKRLRQLSGRKGLSARIGGDEFLLLLSETSDDKQAAQAAKQIITVMSQPYSVEGREIVISCSVGIAMYPDNCSPAALITRADAAMYSAKRAGGSRHCFYSPELDEASRSNFELLADLRNAVAKDEFELHYQPKIDAKTGQVTAAEALLRWRHPQRGMVMPGDFIHVAERFGLIGAIGDWVINDACRQVREWREKGLRMRVAINLSAQQMRQDDIVDRIAEALKKYSVHPSLLTCEITETAAMENTRATQETFRRLGELGAHVSIDDFGIDQSSLARLSHLPVAELKIERTMVMDIEHSPRALAVVDAVVKLAHALSLKVVAEGVENQRQQQLLVDLGCDELQGFLFARPMSQRALLLWALGGRTDAPKFKPSLFGETRAATPEQKAQTRLLSQQGPVSVQPKGH
jgi:diguanylate cyclase (GGDEF)-like protein